MLSPEVPPLKRPSVTSAHALPRPLPFRNEVGYSISCMPGPPFGPSYEITTTSPASIWSAMMASHAASCEWKTRAAPSNFQDDSSTPAVFTMQPSVGDVAVEHGQPAVRL